MKHVHHIVGSVKIMHFQIKEDSHHHGQIEFYGDPCQVTSSKYLSLVHFKHMLILLVLIIVLFPLDFNFQ